MAELRSKHDEAAIAGEPLPWRNVRGFALSIGPHGAHGYPVYVECPEFRLRMTDSFQRPTVYAEIRSAFLHGELGARGAYAESVAVAKEIVGGPLSEPEAARVDLYADGGGWRLVQADREGFVTHAVLAAYFRAGTDDYETISVGKAPLMVRIYRKDIEVRRKGGHAPVFWNGWEGAVTRVEVEAWTEHLRRLQIRTVEDAFAAWGDVWRHATSEFFELRIPGPGAREGWRVRPEWEWVQQVGATEFPSSGLVPFEVVRGDVERIEWALYGYATSYGAYMGMGDPHTLLAHLERRLPIIGQAREFSAEVNRKRLIRVPRSVRQAAAR